MSGLKATAKSGHRAFTKRRTCEKNKLINDWLTWAFLKLAKGERVMLYGLGVLHLKWRAGRTTVFKRHHGSFPAMTIIQPDSWTLKIKTSATMRKALVELAKTVRPEGGKKEPQIRGAVGKKKEANDN